MEQRNKELIESLLDSYGWIELEQLSEDILEWIKKDKERYYNR